MIIRQEEETDYSEIYDLVIKSFATADYCAGDEHDYLNNLRKKQTFIPSLSLVAEADDGKLLGQIALSKMQIKTQDKVITELLISPLSVHPQYFRKGIGRALVEEAICRAKKYGYSAVFLCGNPIFYKKLNFIPTYNYDIYHINDHEHNAEWCMAREINEGYLTDIRGCVDIV